MAITGRKEMETDCQNATNPGMNDSEETVVYYFLAVGYISLRSQGV
jgi:hypothetical protein